VLYYVEGNYKARRGIEQGSLSLHPQGIPHGPHPGTVEASIGATHTNELAVMCDTFAPLFPTKAAIALDDLNYPRSWESGWTPEERSAAMNGSVPGGAASNRSAAKTGRKSAKSTAVSKKGSAAVSPRRSGGAVNTWS
jgi:homogentisate 1,2-dioxygenase